MSRYRLFPTSAQEARLLNHCAHARFVWNMACEQQSWWRPGRGSPPGYVAQARQLTEARAESGWLAAGSVTVQQQALRDFAQAMKNFFAGTHRRPTWRKAGRHESFRQVGFKPAHLRTLSRRWAEVWVPKVGWVRLRLSRPIPPGVTSYRIKRDRASRWHVAFAHVPDAIPSPGNGEVVGIDRGVAVSAALSSGRLLHVPGLTEGETRRLALLRRRLSRAVRGSNRRARLKAQIARMMARVADRRRDWIEQTSTRLARDFDLIGVEDLNIKAMTRSAQGTLNKPGRHVRGKARLNRGILANGWGGLVRRLEDKAPGRIVKINAAYTSQTCHTCGHRAPENRESQAAFRCVACGLRVNADLNAAHNIAHLARLTAGSAAGRAVAAPGGPGLPEPANREPRQARLTSVA
ncbi:transposase [Actinomadura barringtoniae]|uniref:Transposase n=1 Tax=Actinomadura barringtoniae TaxID=1427535 RepID=A0A939PLE9_9ACTN|nr:RNA-guided endonuclease TnpB family protein [Actinomadura barringtoniae]MBO2451309.1 transposase [Actinomadura barringtoniae]